MLREHVMKAPEESFRSYLRCEVDTAGKRYEQAVEKVFALTGAPTIQTGPDLADAAEAVSQTLRLYTGTLRRLANFTAQQVAHA